MKAYTELSAANMPTVGMWAIAFRDAPEPFHSFSVLEIIRRERPIILVESQSLLPKETVLLGLDQETSHWWWVVSRDPFTNEYCFSHRDTPFILKVSPCKRNISEGLVKPFH